MDEQAAIRWRISQLRSEISKAEREVEALKQTLGNKGARRPGLTGAMARTGETLAARWDRSMSVFNRQFAANQDDPIGYLVDEWSATLRLASNFSLARGYLLQSPSLVTHSPAIYSRIAQLEPYAPGLLAVVERWLPVIEPHLDDILERLDDIEPHLPYVIENIDVLAPQCGTALHPRPSPHPRILSLLTIGPAGPRPTVITSSNRTPLPPLSARTIHCPRRAAAAPRRAAAVRGGRGLAARCHAVRS